MCFNSQTFTSVQGPQTALYDLIDNHSMRL